ncbi:MAG: hypothetical protein AVO34_13860 [Firmicutes bacterium ML8_F2]|nr:MAG: hypothetical protein AVO34_13860 [Firmicutes bacterium ML8_F2]
MTLFGYAFIVLGFLLLLLTPALIYIIKNYPRQVVRPIWQDQVTTEFATTLGIALAALAFIFSILLIVFGCKLLQISF